MKRMKLVCPNNPEHGRFTTNVPVMEAWECDEHGDFLRAITTIGPIEKPTKDNEWSCLECDTPAVVEMTGLDQEEGTGKEEEAEEEEDEEEEEWEPELIESDRPREYWVSSTVAAARRHLFGIVDRDGKTQCPVCDKIANRQIYHIGASEAVALMALISKSRFGPSQTGFVNWRNFLPVRTGLAQLEIWGLAESYRENSGMWRATQEGEEFAEEHRRVAKTAVKYNGRLLHFRPPWVEIDTCFKREADYEDGLRCMRNEADLSLWVRRMHRIRD